MAVTERIEEDEDLRKQAVARIQKKREFGAHLISYVMVNALLIAIWAIAGGGFFWPIFPLMGWGIGIVFHAWDTYSRPPTDDQIRREMERLRTS
ncbi:MAG TPA: 2TM domain-containing protein [Actinomycetota bacterium]|nr:2TM domain-containing protein [Actinomycetota bacterium]